MIRILSDRVCTTPGRIVRVVRPFLLPLLCLALLLTSCTSDERAAELLSRAERLLPSAPDSARVVLEELDAKTLSRRTGARYALLYTQALCEGGHPTGSDSLIRSAWEYYGERTEEPDSRCRTLYYWGCVKLRENDRQEAQRLFLQAEALLREHPDPRYLGRVYLHLGDIHCDEADFRVAGHYYGEARRNFQLAGDTAGEAQALSRQGAVAYKTRQIGKAIRCYAEAFDLADDLPDKELAHECLKNLAPLYFILDEAVPAGLMQRMEAFARQGGDHMMLDVQLLRHRPDSARHYLRRMKERIAGPQDHIDYHHAGYWVEVFAEDTRAATHHLQRYLYLTDSVAQRTFRVSAGEIRQNYFEERLRFAEYKMRNRTLGLVALVGATILLAAAVGVAQRRKLRMQQLRIDSYLQAAVEAREAYEALYERTNRGQERPKDLTATRFRVIERIGRTYYEQENTPRQKEAIYQEVRRIIDDISTDAEIRRELEQIVDSTRQNAMQRLRRAYPALKDSDLQLLCYVFCGFSPQIVSLFMHDTIENVYARKSRLKSRIKASDSPDREFFLSLFG